MGLTIIPMEFKMCRAFVCLWFVFFLLTAANSQVQTKALSNDDVIQMTSLGLSDDVIIEKIRSVAATNFDTSVGGLKLLKAAKVSDAVLKAMINPHASLPDKKVAQGSTPDGKALAARAVDYMGGLSKLQSIKSVRIDSTWIAKPPQGQGSVHVETIVVLPDRIRVEEELPEGRFTAVVTPEAAFESARDTGLWDMTAEQRMEMLRTDLRDPTYVGQHLNDPAFTFAEVGTEKIGDTETRMVAIDGPEVSVRWFVEPQTGRILREAYSEEGMIVTTDFEDWETKDGLTLPYVFESSKDTVRYNSIQINPAVDPKMFERPAASSVDQTALAHTVATPAGVRGNESTGKAAQQAPDRDALPATGVNEPSAARTEVLKSPSMATVMGQSSTRSGQATEDEITQKSIEYAAQATADFISHANDPTSFTLLKVIAVTQSKKKNNKVSYAGCVHFVGSNLYGGRMQTWGSYTVDKNGYVTYWINPSGECYVGGHYYWSKGDPETRVDVTDAVRQSLMGK